MINQPVLALEQTDLLRIAVNATLVRKQKSVLGQFFTPAPIASFMASLFDDLSGNISLLDPGCGIGVLFSAFVDVAVSRQQTQSISVTGYEIDKNVHAYLEQTEDICAESCRHEGINFTWDNIFEDFITFFNLHNTLFQLDKKKKYLEWCENSF